MAHSCPKCGSLCHCNGDIDDLDFGERYDCLCCDEEEDDDDEWDDIDDSEHPLNHPHKI